MHVEWNNAASPHHLRRPVMLQCWESLTFLHWAYEPASIAPLLPAGLELDTFEGRAWIGLAPFLLTNLRLPFGPAAPWLGRFPETNVRTYVRGPDGASGVWFFTLEADRLAAVLGARALYHLPYRWARMSVAESRGRIEYRSERHPSFGYGSSIVSIEPGEAFESSPFDNFLTARYRLYASWGGRVATARIEHEPWQFQRARVLVLQQTLIESCGLARPSGEPVAHFSRTLDVRVDRLRSARSARSASTTSA